MSFNLQPAALKELVFHMDCNSFSAASFRDLKMEKAFSIFDKQLNKFIIDNSIHGVFISMRDNQPYVLGEQNVVTLIKSDPNISIQDLVERIKELTDRADDEEKLQVYSWRGKGPFPLIPVDPNGRSFSSDVARSYLRKCLNILGFEKGSFKKYGQENHEPDGWPSEMSWISFKGPNHAKISEVKCICRALFRNHMEGT